MFLPARLSRRRRAGRTVSGCQIALMVSTYMLPLIAVLSGGPAPGTADDSGIELGAAVTALDLESVYGGGYCGYGPRVAYPWGDNLLFEGEYGRYVDAQESHTQSLFLAGPRIGVRKGMLGAFVKLQPGVIRGVRSYYLYYPELTKSKLALSAGGVVEAHVDTRFDIRPYFRFVLSYLIMWFGDAPGTSRHPQWSVGIGFR